MTGDIYIPTPSTSELMSAGLADFLHKHQETILFTPPEIARHSKGETIEIGRELAICRYEVKRINALLITPTPANEFLHGFFTIVHKGPASVLYPIEGGGGFLMGHTGSRNSLTIVQKVRNYAKPLYYGWIDSPYAPGTVTY